MSIKLNFETSFSKECILIFLSKKTNNNTLSKLLNFKLPDSLNDLNNFDRFGAQKKK